MGFIWMGLFMSIIFTALTFAYYMGQRSIRRSECYRLGMEEGINIGIQRARIAHAMGKEIETIEFK